MASVIDAEKRADRGVVLPLNLDAALGLQDERCGTFEECFIRLSVLAPSPVEL